MRHQIFLSAILLVAGSVNAFAGPIAKGQSVFGSKVRSAPSMEGRQLFSIPEGAPVTFLEETGSFLSDWQWVKVRHGSKEGYVWGGTVCTTDVQLKGVHFGCNN